MLVDVVEEFVKMGSIVACRCGEWFLAGVRCYLGG